ncbi:dihydrodipicolinate synthase family protein [Hyphomonas sp.]|uniref:dihydrodipicolinate synthase family protein n=1 Tax=Hyphomonas sp. TaxID=87 RepID=UPI000A4D4DF1|nr:dihydrodipicolinate synthase family protein [Hyphomonas sp.]
MTIDFKGVIPATAVPFNEDLSIDAPGVARFAKWLSGRPGVKALMTNGHTGEVFSLTSKERAEITRLTVNAVGGRVPVISSVVCEGILDAIEHAELAKKAGAAALDIMPPHHWLRFGFDPRHVIEYFNAISEACQLPLIVHVYPAWTKASYSSGLLGDLARLDCVQGFKIGTREMNKYARDIAAIRSADPNKAILTCHDEYLLASMVQGIDGALVGVASLIPDYINELLVAVSKGDLREAQRVQSLIDPIKEAVYGGGEPTGDAHARMKAAMVTAGIFERATVRPPTTEPSAQELKTINAAVVAARLKYEVAA